MKVIRLQLFGGFEVEQDGKPLRSFESDKARALLAYLVVENGRAHLRDSLTGLFWPEVPERNARHSLSQALSSLKSLLPVLAGSRNPLLEITPHEIRFSPQDCWLDLLEFEELLRACEGHEHNPDWACRACLERLERASELYRGDFLSGLNLKDCAVFEEWLLSHREEYQQKMIRVVEQLSRGLEILGDAEKALVYARREIGLDPLDEAAHRHVMRLLAGLGRRADALAQYESCHKILADELGVEPEMSTAALYQQILERPEASLPPWTKSHNLPAPLTRMVGREVELEQLCLKLTDPASRLVTVLGPGGAGKTRLALEAGKALLPVFMDGVFMVELGTQRSQSSLAPAITRAVGLDRPPGHEYGGFNLLDSVNAKDAQVQLQYDLRSKNLLLILDGFENLLHEVGLVHALLRSAPHLKILATSRARLNLEVEQLFLLEGLTYPDETTILQDLDNYSAVQLYVETARRAEPGFEITGSNWLAISEICRLTQGIPLGILLAASWAGTLDPVQLVSEIRRSLDVLFSDWHDLPDRQRSLRATFDYSYRLLCEEDKTTFLNLSIFHGPFVIDRAQQVAGASLHTLRTLINQSLLLQAGPNRYQVHDLLRQFAQEKLAARPEENLAIHQRYCQTFLDALAEWEPELKSPRQLQALAAIDCEYADVMVAWMWALSQGLFPWLKKAGDALLRYLFMRSRFAELDVFCHHAMEHLEGNGLTADSLWIWIDLAAWRVVSLYRRQKYENGWQVIRQVDEKLHDWDPKASQMEKQLAFFYLTKGDFVVNSSGNRLQALDYLQQGLKLAYSSEDTWMIAYALCENAGCHGALGNIHESIQYAQQALEFQPSQEDPYLRSQILNVLDFSFLMSGQYERGLHLLQEQISCLEGFTDAWNLETKNVGLALALLHAGQFEKARPLFIKSAVFHEQLSGKSSQIGILVFLDYIDLHMGNYQRVIDEQNYPGISLSKAARKFTGLAKGGAYLASAAYDQAEQELNGFIDINRSFPRLDVLGASLGLLGTVAYRRGKTEEAFQILEEGLQNAVTQGFYDAYNQNLAALAMILADAGEIEQAVELYATATIHPVAANSKLYEDLYGKHIARLAQSLPHEILDAAQARGRSRTPAATSQEWLERLRTPGGLLADVRKQVKRSRQ